MEFSATDWVTVALTEATLSREGPPLFVAAQRGCVAALDNGDEFIAMQVTRALANRELNASNAMRIFLREVSVGVLNGATLACGRGRGARWHRRDIAWCRRAD